MLLVAVAATAAVASPPDPGYRFAARLAREGPRPAASAAERRTHERVARTFAAAGLRAGEDAFAVPGRGRSRNVLGIHDAAATCLVVLMAHADTVPPSPGAEDNASGVGVLAALAPRLAAVDPPCDVWLAATGAEERLYTGRPDHLGAQALVRRVRRLGRARDLRLALSLDEVGRGRVLHLRAPAPRPAVLHAARGSGLRVRWAPEPSAAAGMSDHREFNLAGLPGAKLGVPANPCRHHACDRAPRLQPRTFRGTRRLVERLLATVP